MHELQDLSLGDHVGRFRHDLDHRLRPQGGHHLECAGVHKIADEHTRLIAEYLIRGFAPASHGGAVHHVIVKECCGVDELDDCRRHNVVVAVVAASPPGQYHQQGS